MFQSFGLFHDAKWKETGKRRTVDYQPVVMAISCLVLIIRSARRSIPHFHPSHLSPVRQDLVRGPEGSQWIRTWGQQSLKSFIYNSAVFWQGDSVHATCPSSELKRRGASNFVTLMHPSRDQRERVPSGSGKPSTSASASCINCIQTNKVTAALIVSLQPPKSTCTLALTSSSRWSEARQICSAEANEWLVGNHSSRTHFRSCA